MYFFPLNNPLDCVMNPENKRYVKDLSHKPENFAFFIFFTTTQNGHLWVEAAAYMK